MIVSNVNEPVVSFFFFKNTGNCYFAPNIPHFEVVLNGSIDVQCGKVETSFTKTLTRSVSVGRKLQAYHRLNPTRCLHGEKDVLGVVSIENTSYMEVSC